MEILKLKNNIYILLIGAKLSIVVISVEPVVVTIQIENNSKALSLSLLNVKALNADFKDEILVDQKLINKKDVNPINSQPKKREIILFEKTNKDILYINMFM
jgi:hypothetical protein